MKYFNYYKELWEKPKPAKILSDADVWDVKAAAWNKELHTDQNFKEQSLKRVSGTAEFLRQQGVLRAGSRVLDIGCGLGLFAAEFAGTAGSVLGVDLSPVMVEYARKNAQDCGISNVEFQVCDLKEADLKEFEWEQAFDLVTASLTPAVTCLDDLYKVMKMSRKYCFHVSFVKMYDSMEDRIVKELYHDKVKKHMHKDGRIFYSLFNILYLEGYYPQVSYLDMNSQVKLAANRETAELYASYLKKENEADIQRILEFLQQIEAEKGMINSEREECYGFILWDVTNKRETIRTYG